MAILDELRRDRGLAMIFITHDLELAAAVCDRTAVMYAGQIVEVNTSRHIEHDPLHPYTAALLRSRPRIDVTLHRLDAIPGQPLSSFEAPAGACAFAERCPHAADACRSSGAAAGGGRRWSVALPPARRAARRAAGGGPWLSTCSVVDTSSRTSARSGPSTTSASSWTRGARWRSSASRVRARPRSPGSIVGLERRHLGHDRRVRHRPQPPRRAAAVSDAAAGSRGADRLPGPVHEPRPAPDRPQRDRRDRCTARRRRPRCTCGAGRRADAARRARRTPGGRAAAQTVGRPAPAGRDRAAPSPPSRGS